MFPVKKPSGISGDSDDWFSLVGSSKSLLVLHLGVNFVLTQFLVPLYWRGFNGFFVVSRSCRALLAEKLPITRVVPILVSISLPNKGVGHSGTTRNWWEDICPSQQQTSVWVNLLVVVFPVAPKNCTGLGEEGSRAGDQDRVGSPHVNQEILRPTCHIQLHPWLQPHDGYVRQAGWLERAASVLLNHHEGRLGA